MTQNSLILKHLKEKGSITPLEALELYGCFRLSARIHNLRENHNIKMILVEMAKINLLNMYWRRIRNVCN